MRKSASRFVALLALCAPFATRAEVRLDTGVSVPRLLMRHSAAGIWSPGPGTNRGELLNPDGDRHGDGAPHFVSAEGRLIASWPRGAAAIVIAELRGGRVHVDAFETPGRAGAPFAILVDDGWCVAWTAETGLWCVVDGAAPRMLATASIRPFPTPIPPSGLGVDRLLVARAIDSDLVLTTLVADGAALAVTRTPLSGAACAAFVEPTLELVVPEDGSALVAWSEGEAGPVQGVTCRGCACSTVATLADGRLLGVMPLRDATLLLSATLDEVILSSVPGEGSAPTRVASWPLPLDLRWLPSPQPMPIPLSPSGNSHDRPDPQPWPIPVLRGPLELGSEGADASNGWGQVIGVHPTPMALPIGSGLIDALVGLEAWTASVPDALGTRTFPQALPMPIHAGSGVHDPLPLPMPIRLFEGLPLAIVPDPQPIPIHWRGTGGSVRTGGRGDQSTEDSPGPGVGFRFLLGIDEDEQRVFLGGLISGPAVDPLPHPIPPPTFHVPGPATSGFPPAVVAR